MFWEVQKVKSLKHIRRNLENDLAGLRVAKTSIDFAIESLQERIDELKAKESEE
jgi:hypothetical protein